MADPVLESMARELQGVVRESQGIDLNEALKRSAERYRTTPGRMKYALTFARVRGMVVVDYDTATLTAAN